MVGPFTLVTFCSAKWIYTKILNKIVVFHLSTQQQWNTLFCTCSEYGEQWCKRNRYFRWELEESKIFISKNTRWMCKWWKKWNNNVECMCVAAAEIAKWICLTDNFHKLIWIRSGWAVCVCLARIASTFGTRSNVVEVTFEFMATIVCVYFMANGWKTIVHSTQLLFTEIKLLRMLEGESEREKMLFGQRAYLDQPQCRHFRCCAILSIEKRKKALLWIRFALPCCRCFVLCHTCLSVFRRIPFVERFINYAFLCTHCFMCTRRFALLKRSLMPYRVYRWHAFFRIFKVKFNDRRLFTVLLLI